MGGFQICPKILSVCLLQKRTEIMVWKIERGVQLPVINIDKIRMKSIEVLVEQLYEKEKG